MSASSSRSRYRDGSNRDDYNVYYDDAPHIGNHGTGSMRQRENDTGDSKISERSSENRHHHHILSSTSRTGHTQQQHHQHKHRQRQGMEEQSQESDWTIHVSRPSGTRDLYYIHTRVVDGLTSRRIPYFAPVLKDQLIPIGDRTSQLSLPDDLAEIFEVFLDFLYKGEDIADEEEFLYNVKHGLALFRLAEHFQINPLRQRLESFYKQLSLPFSGQSEGAGSGGAVGDHSTIDNSESHTEKKKMLSKSIGTAPVVMVNPKDELEQFAMTMQTLEFVEQTKLDPLYILKALKKRRELGMTGKALSKSDSENISCLVALCIKHHRQTVKRSTFYKLTQEQYLPYIDQEAALQLLVIEMERGFWDNSDNFSSVQARCIQSLLADWKGLRRKFESPDAFWKTLRGLSPNVLGILLMQSSGTVCSKDSMGLGEDLASRKTRESKAHGQTEKESRDDTDHRSSEAKGRVSSGKNGRDGVETSRIA